MANCVKTCSEQQNSTVPDSFPEILFDQSFSQGFTI